MVDVPTPAQLRAAADTAARDRSVDTKRFAVLLDAIAAVGDVELTALAERLLAEAGAQLWLTLDVSIRRISWFDGRRSKPFARGIRRRELSLLELVLAACDESGHVREAAVERLSGMDRPAVLPVLALRSADWVAQVRDRARLACQHRLEQAPSAAFPELAPVALAIRERRTGAWLASTLESLVREGPDEVLMVAMASADRRTRRLAYTAGLTASRLTLGQLVRGALTDGDLPIRLACADAAYRSGDPYAE